MRGHSTRGHSTVAYAKRAGYFTAAAVASLVSPAGSLWADGRCDLNTVVGYQIVFAKPIDGYIQDRMRKKGYGGCEPDRVLVFADNTGVKCKTVVRQSVGELPTGYLFFRADGDLKLCVEGELFDVSRTN